MFPYWHASIEAQTPYIPSSGIPHPSGSSDVVIGCSSVHSPGPRRSLSILESYSSDPRNIVPSRLSRRRVPSSSINLA